uniref:Uncharacterized protein n=1 Tax=Phytophthora ramorum TaxID=164328 RepID=H3HEA1_PHYRM
MESTLSLVETAAHVGQSVRFIAAVQQIAADKRVLVKRQCVQACHVLHVGDASRQFFKVTCWGDAPPSLIQSTAASGSEGEANPMQLSSADAVLRVGDIVLFSSCRIKSYRGNVEAQFLLYRKGRYFSTQDVQLKDLYPMIEWAVIKDLRENMIASVICELRSSKDGTSATSGGAVGVASELDGVLLCELIMYDTARDAMTVNLWDQHAEKRFVARLLEHRGAVEIDGIVALLELPSQKSNGQHRYAACANKCKVRRGSTVDAPCGWRYRRFIIILRDFRDERLQVEVDNQATVEMVGNIEAEPQQWLLFSMPS